MGYSRFLKGHRNLIESFLSLSIVNGVNMLLPFVSLPYMLRIIGPSNYGIYSYVYTIIQYCVLIVSYGFIFTATKQIAQNRDNRDNLISIFNSIIFSKFVIFFIVILFISLISPFIFDSLIKVKQFYWGIGIILGEILMPTFLFQGMEKMRFLALINIIPKVIFTLLIFVVVKKPEDYEYIILLNSLGFIIAGVIGVITACYNFNLKFSKPNVPTIKYQLKDGFNVFASTLGINMYRNSNIIVLGLLCSDAAVGIYGAAEKLIKAIQSAITPLTQALFPHSANKFKDLPLRDCIKQIFRLSKYIGLILILGSIFVYFLAPEITRIILGDEFISAYSLIRIMIPVIVLGGINYIIGVIGLIIMGKGRQFLYIVIIGGLACILTTWFFSPKYTYYAASWGMSIAEFIVSVLCVIYLLYLYYGKINVRK